MSQTSIRQLKLANEAIKYIFEACLPLRFQQDSRQLVTSLQYPSIKSAISSAEASEGHVIVKGSLAPFIFSFTKPFKVSFDIVWMERTSSKDATCVGCKTKSSLKSSSKNHFVK